MTIFLRTTLLLIAISSATTHAGNVPESYYEQGVAGRKAAAKLPAMRDVYIDPCNSPDQLRRWWKPLATPALEAARIEIERYRNVMDCKGILIYDVPDYRRESAFWTALDAGDAGAAKQLGTALRESAERVIVNETLVTRRIAQVQDYADDSALGQPARERLTELLRDARSELRAKRYISASFVLNHAFSVALQAGAKRPDYKRCRYGADPTRGC